MNISQKALAVLLALLILAIPVGMLLAADPIEPGNVSPHVYQPSNGAYVNGNPSGYEEG